MLQLASFDTMYSALGLERRGTFDFSHRRGNHGKLCCECSAETAARLRLAHLDQLEPLHLCEQLARLFLVSKLAQSVAAIMKRHAMRKTRAKLGDAKLCHKKIAELIALRRQRRRDAGLSGLREKIRVEFLDHRPARAGGDYDGLGSPLSDSARARRPVAPRSNTLS